MRQFEGIGKLYSEVKPLDHFHCADLREACQAGSRPMFGSKCICPVFLARHLSGLPSPFAGTAAAPHRGKGLWCAHERIRRERLSAQAAHWH